MPTPPLILDLGELRKDDPNFLNPGVISALNVIPRLNSYGPFPSLQPASSNGLDSTALGAISARDASNNTYVYAGTATKLYEMVGYAFTDESKVGGYTTAAGDVWEFANWGVTNKIIATNYTDAVQSITVGGGASGAFADMITSTNKPKAKHVGVVGRFVVLGFTNDATDGERKNRVWWSGIGDETNFDPAAATQSDFEDLATGGAVQRILGWADYGLIFQTDLVRTMRFVGGSVVHELLPLNYVPGTPIPNSVISYKNMVFYISESGFMALGGGQATHIGDGRVDRMFWNEFDVANRSRLSAAIDPKNKIVAWAFPGAGSSAGNPNRMLLCKYDQAKWAEAEVSTDMLLQTETQGYTLDGLDTVGTDIDDATVFDQSLDSEKWQGGKLRFGAFDGNAHKLSFFNGVNKAAQIETGDLMPMPGHNWLISGIGVGIDMERATTGSEDPDVIVRVAKRGTLIGTPSFGSIRSGMNVNQYVPLRSEGKFQRIRVNINGSLSWNDITTLAVDYTVRGRR